jgi:hypothetical protein
MSKILVMRFASAFSAIVIVAAMFLSFTESQAQTYRARLYIGKCCDCYDYDPVYCICAVPPLE